MGLFGTQTKNEKITPVTTVEPKEETFQEPPRLPKPRVGTVIAPEIVISGALRGEGIVQVEGVIEGEVELKGSIIITSTGVVKGPIVADVVRVAGRVEGNVNAKNHLRLEKQGNLIGDVTTGSLVVEDGGCLNGRCEMTKPPEDEANQEYGRQDQPDDLQFGANYNVEDEPE